MPHPYDASMKYLIQTRLADWMPLSGRTTTARVEIIDSDLATVTAAADRVLRIHEDPAWILHLEPQSSRDPGLLPNLPVYNGLLERRHGLLVRTVVLLLRRSADAPELTGVVQRQFSGEPPYLVFRYQVVRIWQIPVQTFLSGGLGILPLAPLSSVAETDLPAVIQQMDRKIHQESTPEETGTLWTATAVLMGLRYSRERIQQLLHGVRGMKDSVIYQAIVEEGKVQMRQEDLLQLGRRRFGPPSQETEDAVRRISDLDHLGRLLDRVLDATAWEELLETP